MTKPGARAGPFANTSAPPPSCPRLARASTSCFHCISGDVNGRDISTFTRVFNALCPALTGRDLGVSRTYSVVGRVQLLTPLRIMKLS